MEVRRNMCDVVGKSIVRRRSKEVEDWDDDRSSLRSVVQIFPAELTDVKGTMHVAVLNKERRIFQSSVSE